MGETGLFSKFIQAEGTHKCVPSAHSVLTDLYPRRYSPSARFCGVTYRSAPLGAALAPQSKGSQR
jgi:hypothetical protein